jgi:hypothetical protein
MSFKYTNTLIDLYPELLECEHEFEVKEIQSPTIIYLNGNFNIAEYLQCKCCYKSKVRFNKIGSAH